MTGSRLMAVLNLKLQSFIKASAYDVIIQNYFLYPYECDLIRILKSGSVYEYEIKMSRPDFFNDFKKKGYGKNAPLKHDDLKSGKLKPNYFFFVIKKGIVSYEEVPDHCGIIEFDWRESEFGDYLKIDLIRNAKRLHKRKFDKWHDIAMRLAFRDNQSRRQKHYRYMQQLEKYKAKKLKEKHE